MIKVIREQCTGCGICEVGCAFGAIEMFEGKPSVTDRCVGCGVCVKKCPCNALKMTGVQHKMQDFDSYQDIWVILEMDTSRNQLRKVSLELLSEARCLADRSGQRVGAVLLTDELPEDLEKQLSRVGCDYACLIRHNQLRQYHTLLYAENIVQMIRRYKPAAVLLPATENGRDLAPRISCMLQTGLTADCTALDIDADNNLIQIRPTYGGNIMASIVTPNHRPQMASVRPNVLSVRTVDSDYKTKIITEPCVLLQDDPGYRLVETKAKQGAFPDVSEANVLIVAGYGIGSKENFEKLHRLASRSNAALGATRKVVDEGWAPFEVQVGQTGKTVAPDVYIAFGVSGALQHTIGMQNAKFKVAVNNDPAAAIFKVCDMAVLGDAGEIADEMLRQIG